MTIRPLIILALSLACATAHAERPRIAVNIVVSSMRASDLDRYGERFGEGGFRRLLDSGIVFTNCRLDYMPTTTAAGAASISTGTLPAIHGAVSERWFNRNTGKPVSLYIGDRTMREEFGMEADCISSVYECSRLGAQTLSEAAVSCNADSKAVTIALDAESAILTAGSGGECYWIDDKGDWSSADCYMKTFPYWVRSYNETGFNRVFTSGTWYGKYTRNRYLNTRSTDITVYDANTRVKPSKGAEPDIVQALSFTPAGNIATLEFAKKALGTMLPIRGQGCRILNIYIDASRNIAEKYGPESIEYEDMLYCLDAALEDFLTYLYAQAESTSDVVVTLTSDHGTSPSFDITGEPEDRFNVRQFEVIVNAFLSARHGQDKWVLGYNDNSLYLDHDVIFNRKQSLEEIRTEVATFVLQFRGVTHAVSATAMQNGCCGNPVTRRMQNGFYPRRSGDVVICLAPDRIEEREDKVSMSGSPYNYDSRIPLIIYGGGAKPVRTDRRIDITSLAPTVAHMLGICCPSASDAEILEETKR